MPLSVQAARLSRAGVQWEQHLPGAVACSSTGQSSAGQEARLHSDVPLAHEHDVQWSTWKERPDGFISVPSRQLPAGGSNSRRRLPGDNTPTNTT